MGMVMHDSGNGASFLVVDVRILRIIFWKYNSSYFLIIRDLYIAYYVFEDGDKCQAILNNVLKLVMFCQSFANCCFAAAVSFWPAAGGWLGQSLARPPEYWPM